MMLTKGTKVQVVRSAGITELEVAANQEVQYDHCVLLSDGWEYVLQGINEDGHIFVRP